MERRRQEEPPISAPGSKSWRVSALAALALGACAAGNRARGAGRQDRAVLLQSNDYAYPASQDPWLASWAGKVRHTGRLARLMRIHT